MKRIVFLAFAVILGVQVSAQVQVDSIVDPATFPELSIVSDANARLLSKNGGTWNLVLPSSLQTDVENGWGVVSPDSTGNITWLGRFKRNNADQKLYFTDFEGDRVLINDPSALAGSLSGLSLSNDTLTYTQNDGTTGFIILPSGGGSGTGVVFSETAPADSSSVWVDSDGAAFIRKDGIWAVIGREYQFPNIDGLISNTAKLTFQDDDWLLVQSTGAMYKVAPDTTGYYLDSVYCVPLDNGKYAKMYFENGVVEVAKGEPLADITTPGDDTDLVLKAIRQCNLSRQRSLRFDGNYYFDPRVADFDIGRQNTSAATNQSLLVEINGTLVGDTTFQINSYVHLKGTSGDYLGTQFSYDGSSRMAVNDFDPATQDTFPTLMILGNGINKIENLNFENTDSYFGGIAIGSERDSIGGSNVSLEKVGVTMLDHPGAVGIKLYGTFWVWMDEVVVNANPTTIGVDADSRATIEIREEKATNGTSSGFRYLEHLVISGKPIIISGDNDGTVGTHFDKVDCENMTGEILEIYSEDINYMGNMTFSKFTDHDRPAAYVDSTIVKIEGSNARNIGFYDWSIDPKRSGKCKNCIFINTDRPFEYSSYNEFTESGQDVTTGEVNINYGQVDAKIASSGHITMGSVQPGIIFPSMASTSTELVAADNTDSLTITGGQYGPDWSTEAVLIESNLTTDAANFLTLMDQSGYSFNDGEYFLVGGWVRSTSDTTASHRFQNKSILRLQTDASNVTFEDDMGNATNVRYISNSATGVVGQGWHFVSAFFKVNNPSSSSGRIIVELVYNQDDFYLFKPFIMKLDETDPLTKRDRIKIAQTFMYPDEAASKGDYVIPAKRAMLNGHYLAGLDLPFGTGNNRAVYVTTDSTLADMPITYDPTNNTLSVFQNPPQSTARFSIRNSSSSLWGLQLQATYSNSVINFARFEASNLSASIDSDVRFFIGANPSTNRGVYLGFDQNPEISSGIPDTLNAFYATVVGSGKKLRYNGYGDLLIDGGTFFLEDNHGIYHGTGDPGTNVSADPGSIYIDKNGGTRPLFVKTTGTDSLGWAPVLVDPQVQTLTASGTYSKGSTHVVLDGSSSGVVLTLEATPSTGCKILEVVAKDISNAVSIDGNGNNINGAATYTFSAAYEGVTLFFDGTEWYAY